jgi:hypothetical protein
VAIKKKKRPKPYRSRIHQLPKETTNKDENDQDTAMIPCSSRHEELMNQQNHDRKSSSSN